MENARQVVNDTVIAMEDQLENQPVGPWAPLDLIPLQALTVHMPDHVLDVVREYGDLDAPEYTD
jgi:hypothetical protein